MPLIFKACFLCNECGDEYSTAVSIDVSAFPVALPFGVKQPPPGWSVEGVVAKCPRHASRVLKVTPHLSLSTARGQ